MMILYCTVVRNEYRWMILFLVAVVMVRIGKKYPNQCGMRERVVGINETQDN